MYRGRRGRRGGRGGSTRGRRRYGFFQCSRCNAHWESSHVYRKGGYDYYQQECKTCRIAVSPYKVEPIKCSMCGEENCICSDEDREERHNDSNRPHRSDLCERCKKGLKCGR
ncbi:hypothetical protein ACJMK2_019903 [Sinanodonta woodiana]|uniref:3CxxC-type domain-containing protein n=1 Tax=Sinanodonta woodiana TaxID=1069815 RepID=A0ABD3TXK8_SINWO